MKKYKVASEAGANYTGSAVDEIVELELDDSDEQALIAAGWLEPAKKGGDK